ncbi:MULTISPECIES: hypothetical protein [Floridanema]|jgi:hypothetical protein|uniref:DUF3885 domain-containing protein n=2 Tax=Floridanema TaxID=3396149 RepID=A0ABV4YDM9_9CYAN
MLSHVPDLAVQVSNWQFLELWVDPIVFPPRILMLVSDNDGKCGVYDPSANYQLKFSSLTYDEAHSWLLEDDYERVDGRLLAEEVM